MSDKEAAKAARVSRQTLNQWRNHNADFRTAIEKARQDLWSDSRARIRALCSKACDTLNRALNNDNLPAALGIIKAAANFEKLPGPPPGPVEYRIVQTRNKLYSGEVAELMELRKRLNPDLMTDEELRTIDTGEYAKMTDEELRAIAWGRLRNER